MACANDKLFRYKVRIIGSPFEVLPVPKVTKVTGVSLGQDGTVEIPEYNKTITLSDGIAKFEPLNIVVRYELSPESVIAYAFFLDFWKHRSTKTYTIHVEFTKRNWCPVVIYKFMHCSMGGHSFPDTFEIGQMKTLEYAMTFYPYDVISNDLSGKTN